MFRLLFPSPGSRSARRSTTRRRAALIRPSPVPAMVEVLEPRVVLSGVTQLVADIHTGFNSSIPSQLTVLGGRLYFAALSGTFDLELWRHDPAAGTTVRLKDIRSGPFGSAPDGLTVLDGRLYFAATHDTSGRELWRHDPATGTTEQVADINPDSGNSSPLGFTVLDGRLYFAASDGTSGSELWRHDPVAGTTVQVADINPGSGSSAPFELTVLDGRLYFAAFDGTSGRELWRHDPVTGTTERVADINTDSGSSSPLGFTVLDSRLYFAADDGTSGSELRRHDPATGTTERVADINPGSGSSSPLGFTELDGRLYFAATHDTSGRELWRHDPAGTNQPPTAVAGRPYTVVVGQSVTLDGSASTDDSATPLVYEWDLDNDGQFDDATGATPVFSAVGLSAGTRTVSLRVTDADGLTSIASTTVDVITVVEFTNNTIVSVSQEITDLNRAGILKTAMTTSLLSKLDAAKAALARENTTAAARQITAVILELEGLVAGRKLTADAAEELTSDLEAALALL